MTTQECKVRLLNEVSAMIVGLHGDHYTLFYNRYSVHTPGYFFNPLFKLGQWDGKAHYFSKNGKTYIYLLEDLLPRLVKLGYKVTIEDLRQTNKIEPDLITDQLYADVIHVDSGEPTILRDYQVSGVNSLIEHGYGILLASTGAGKTIICTALVDTYGKQGIRTLTIVPNQDLIRQTKKDYIHYGLDVGEYSGTLKDTEHLHVISTWQALQKNPMIVAGFQLVLVDECHGAKGPVLQKILTDQSSNIIYRFGVTGTLPKDPSDAMAVHVALGPVRETVSAKSLIDRKVLSNLHIDVTILEEDLKLQYDQYCNEDIPGSKPPTYTQYKDGYFPDYTSEKSYIHRKQARVDWIADQILAKRDQKKGNTMVFVDNIEFGRHLASIIPDAIFVNGKDTKKSKDREAVYELFKTRDDLIVIATVHIAGTGLSINRIFNLFLIDIGKSFIRVIQAVGRGLRTAKDKDFVNITDICSDLKYGKKHLKTRTDYYQEAQYPFKKRKLDYTKMQSIVDSLDVQ